MFDAGFAAVLTDTFQPQSLQSLWWADVAIVVLRLTVRSRSLVSGCGCRCESACLTANIDQPGLVLDCSMARHEWQLAWAHDSVSSPARNMKGDDTALLSKARGKHHTPPRARSEQGTLLTRFRPLFRMTATSPQRCCRSRSSCNFYEEQAFNRNDKSHARYALSSGGAVLQRRGKEWDRVGTLEGVWCSS